MLRQGGGDELIIRSDFNPREARRKEACRAPAFVRSVVDEVTGKEMFECKETPFGLCVSAGMDEDAFIEAWGSISNTALIEEIMQRVYEVNPAWAW